MGSYFTAMRPLVASVMTQLEDRSENHATTTGLPTPFEELNYMTAGFSPLT